MDEYKITIHQSLTRPQLFLGCDRELFLGLIALCALIAGPLGLFKGNYVSLPISFILWICGHISLVKMAKNDSYARHIFIKSLAYKDHYDATSDISASERRRRRQ